MIGETFLQQNVPKNMEPEHDDAWYELQIERLLSEVPDELSERLRNEIDELVLDPKAAYEKVEDLVSRRNSLITALDVDIIDPNLAHVELHENRDDRIRAGASREIADIRNALANPENFLGRGMVATVFESETWPKVCYKVVHNKDLYKKGNRVYQEVGFLGALNDLSVEGVRTPHAYFHSHGAGLIFIGMERLQGFSIDDAVIRRPDLLVELKDRGFNIDEFFRKLKAYLVEMHKRGIYHLDLFARNIMIDQATLEPRIIDFGRSEHFDFESEVPDTIEMDDFEKMKIARKEFESALNR